MEGLTGSLLLLIILIFFFLILAVYLSQQRDRQLLQQQPAAEVLPQSHYEIVLKELNLFKSKYQKFHRDEQKSRQGELYYLERKANGVLMETEKEQQKYLYTVHDWQVAWKDFRDIFTEASFFARTFSPSKGRELKIFREIYLKSRRRSLRERDRILARERIWLQESNNQSKVNQEEIEQHQLPAQGGTSIKTITLEAFHHTQLSTDSLENITTTSLPVTPTPSLQRIDLPSLQNQIRQDSFIRYYPDLSNSTYIGESFSLEELHLEVIRECTFDHSFFVAVHFNGVHQYQSCSFINTDLSQSIFQKATGPHRFLHCDFTGTLFNGTLFEFTAFYNCTFRGTVLQEVQFRKVKFVNCVFESCRVQGVDFSETVMSTNMLENIDFSACSHPPKNWNAS
ncbi:MAG: hypothetical protein COB67_01230 [SAR324 cluster bacterium]|uniref:Pentapeptide repeat-containing protein n=1 Tax=SAR324 cluster bacterium TaxID=2024889 RepID=A0A2A4TB67_9DELT|nr:MAG: hypothetical protein COB67_01230 [SAR324 cluster bacterium]